MRATSWWLSCVLAGATSLVGCGGGGAEVIRRETPGPEEPQEPEAPSGPKPLPTPYDDPLLNSLYALGVPLEDPDAPRVEADGTVRSADYMPLGSTVVLARPPELLCAGIRAWQSLGTAFEDGSFVERLPPSPPDPAQMVLVHTPLDRRWVDSPLRRARGADLDGDGVEEVAIVHRPAGGVLTIEVLDNLVSGYTRVVFHEVPTITGDSIRDLDLGAADLDGDDRDELLVAVSVTGGSARLLVFSLLESEFVERVAWTKSWSVASGHEVGALVEAGNADDDHACELGVVLNETWRELGQDRAAARYLIYDDAGADLVERASGPVQLTTNLAGGGDQVFDAVYANLTFCDVDADRVAEVVIGGLRYFKRPNQDETNYLLLIALEDGNGGFARLGDRASSIAFQPIGNEEDHEYRELRHVWIERLDFDGDRREEILVNHLVFQNFATAGAPWVVLRDLGSDVFLPVDTEYPLTRRTCAVAVADLDEDGKDEVLHVAPQGGSREDRIDVWGDGGTEPYIGIVNLVPSKTDANLDLMLVVADMDGDGTVLQATPKSHRLVYSEPIVLAVLAAPPCKFEIGQNLDACSTSYGTSATISSTNKGSLLQKFTFGVGTKTPPVPGGPEAEAKYEIEAEFKETIGVTQSTTISTTYTTGPLEDTVIFTTIPYDQYEYRVVNHKVPSMRGTKYYVLNPREAITLMVQREFFNAVTPSGDDDVKIGDDVLGHTIGDPSTYRDRGAKDAIVNAATAARPVYQNGAQRVGQGTGSVELGLAIGKETAFDLDIEIMASHKWKLSWGVLVEFSVGLGLGYGLSLSRGTEMSYVGSVGNIDADHFVDEQYAFGLFTHYHTDPASGQTFEVVDYWVED